MKKFFILFMVLPLMSKAQITSFTNGNIVVSRVGGNASNGAGAASLTNASAAIFLDEYTPTGTYVQTVAVPNIVAGNRLTVGGSSSTEGQLTRSTNGGVLLIAGYDQAVGTSAVGSSTGNRVVGIIDKNEVVDLSTTFSYGTNAIRVAVSEDGFNLWFAGASQGQFYIQRGGGNTPLLVSSSITNSRSLGIFNAQLYLSTASGTNGRVGSIGTGLPTTAGNTFTALPSIPTTGSPYQFYFADLSPTVPGVDVLYIADDGAGQGILKYSLVGGVWVANGSIAYASARGLTGVTNGSTVTLYAVNGSTLVSLSDNSGYNSTIIGTINPLANAPTNTAFRGIAFTPQGSVLPATITNFNAAKTANGLSINWQANQEINVSHYEIEKSVDAKNFKKLSSQNAKGINGATINYAITDANIMAAKQYYRLKIVDKDGTYHYSNTIVYQQRSSLQLSVYPNPVVNKLLVLHDAVLANASMQIATVEGKLIQQIPLNTGATQTTINAINLAKGIYIISYKNGVEKSSVRFVK